MDWQDLIQQRQQTFIFEETLPNRELIEKICEEVHARCPSKQNRVKQKLHIITWQDADLRYDLYAHTDRNPTNPNNCKYNPQVLAPYLFIWTERDVEQRFERDGVRILNAEYSNSHWSIRQAEMEIGICSMFTALPASDKGLQSGFCKCIQEEKIEEKYGFKPILMMGIGYAKNNPVSYFCPILKKEMPVPSDAWNPKPEVDQYIFYSV